MVVLCLIARHAEMDMLFIANVYISTVPVQQSGVVFPVVVFMCVLYARAFVGLFVQMQAYD